MKIPENITAGDAVSWTDYPVIDDSGNEFSATDCMLSYSFRGAGAELDITGSPSGTTWVLSIAGAQTAALNSGASQARIFWQAYLTDASGNRATVGQGAVFVAPNFAAQPPTFDGRTQDEVDLDAVRAEISARATGGMTIEYSINGRSLKREPITALLVLEARLLRSIQRARAAQDISNGLGSPRRVMVRFSGGVTGGNNGGRDGYFGGYR